MRVKAALLWIFGILICSIILSGIIYFCNFKINSVGYWVTMACFCPLSSYLLVQVIFKYNKKLGNKNEDTNGVCK